MNGRYKVVVAVAGTALALAGRAAALGPGTPAEPDGAAIAPEVAPDKPAAPENGVCRRSYSSGSGLARFAWCFGTDGSINLFEHSAGFEHTGLTEGFCIGNATSTSGRVHGDDPRSGLNPPTYPAPNKVVHTTTDGWWRIEQTFTQVIDTRSIVITMKLTNTSGRTNSGVRLMRYMDADVSGTAGNDQFIAATRSVVATEPKYAFTPRSVRVELIASTTAVPAGSFIFPNYRPLLTDCFSAEGYGTLSLTGDRSMGVMYAPTPVGAGSSFTATFVYRATT